MPVCPGCERDVPYDRLDTHVQHCAHINGGNAVVMSAIEQLDRRLSNIERLMQYRIQQLEADRKPPMSKARGASGGSSDRNNKP